MKEINCKRLGGIWDKQGKRHQAGSVWDMTKIAPTLDTCQGGGRMPFVLVCKRTKVVPQIKMVGYIGKGGIWGTQPRQQFRVYSSQSVAMALCSGLNSYWYSMYEDTD